MFQEPETGFRSSHHEAQGVNEELSVEGGDSFATPDQEFGEEGEDQAPEDDWVEIQFFKRTF